MLKAKLAKTTSVDPTPLDGLSQRHLVFVAEYARGGTATQAAIKAGYSEDSVSHNVHRLMANDGIKAAIAHVKTQIARRTIYTVDWLLGEHYSNHVSAQKSKRIAESTGSLDRIARLQGYYDEARPDETAIETLKELRESIYRVTHPDGTETETTERTATITERTATIDVDDV
jgi:hypothetical protein